MNDFGELNKKLRTASIGDLREMLASAGMPLEVKKMADTALETLEALSAISPGTAEHANALAYVGYLAGLPWKKAENKPDIKSIEQILNKCLPHEHIVREKILEHLTDKFFNGHKEPKILVVDDERIALESLEHILKKEGYTVVSASNGAKAIEKLKETDFDIVITDLIMGEVDGTAVIKDTINRYPCTEVIMITGYATVDTAVQALRMGAFHYIEKPVKIDELLAAVKDALNRKRRTCKRNVLCLEGSSGANKISLGKMIAEALGRKFVGISMSEIKDESEITGLSRATANARPGRIIEEIRKAGAADAVFMLDGLDMAGPDFKGEFTEALLEVLDPVKNQNFTDRYLDVPFNLSNVIFIVTTDSFDNIPGHIRDFLDVIKL